MYPSSHLSSTSMAEVEIYLATGEVPISFLCIPIKDVERLSVWPFKWLHFVMYTICGTPASVAEILSVERFLQRCMVIQLNMTVPSWPKFDITINLRVKFVSVCEIFCLQQSQFLTKILSLWTLTRRHSII